MAEALAAVSLAGTVVQFVDFAGKLISKGNEYHRSLSGALVEHDELRAVAENMVSLTTALEASLKKFQAERDLSEDEQALRSIARECLKIATEFTGVLKKFKKTGPQKWKSFRQAFKTMWNKDKLDDLLRRLSVARAQLVLNLLVIMSNRANENTTTPGVEIKSLEANMLAVLFETNLEVQKEVIALKSQLSTASKENRNMITSMWQTRNGQQLTELSQNLSLAAEEDRQKKLQEKFLDSLYFAQFQERRSRIPEAHKVTFNWLYEAEDSPSWSEFVPWLQTCDRAVGPYWVSGKAGSGKSTLMKFLYHEDRTKHHLMSWAGSRTLILASSFFWNPGTKMQRSLLGLLQSLLHEILSSFPHDAATISPWRWRQYELGASVLDAWSETELIGALFDTIKLRDDHCVCIFVDGLDEFDGDDEKRLEVIDLLKRLATFANVKMCISSRDWLVYRDAFGEGEKLRLEDLTRQDIQAYVKYEFESDSRFQLLKKRDEVRCTELISELVDRAQGVFLWIHLVVRSLLHGLRNEDRVSDLFRRLRMIPADLEEYFRHIMSRIDQFYLLLASDIFQVALEARAPLSLLALSFTHEEDRQTAVTWIRGNPEPEIMARNHSMGRRLNILCRGLLEIHEESHPGIFWMYSVDFMHRTVRDFLASKEMQVTLKASSSNSFDPNVSLCSSFLAMIECIDYENKLTRLSFNPRDLLELVDDFLFHAHRVEIKLEVTPTDMLDKLGEIVKLNTRRGAEFISCVNKIERGTYHGGFQTFSLGFWQNWLRNKSTYQDLVSGADLHLYTQQQNAA